MRKVLSFVLVLSLVLGSFSMAFAGTEAQAGLSDIKGNANEEAITVNYNLKIIDGMGDGTFAPEKAVTRAQFAAMITRALAVPDSALAGYKATTFKDTAGYSWAVPYLAFCQSKGILVGDGNGNVLPGNTVSVNEAMTMVLRAVGYTSNSAALVGVWPANYVSLAQNNKLYDDVATAVGVTRANAAQIIYNALTVDKVEVAADGTTKVLSDRSNNDSSKWKVVNMLTAGLNCTSTEDYVINGDENTLISLKAYVGQKCTVYKNSDKKIVAVAKVDSDAVKGKFNTDVLLTKATDGSIGLTLVSKFVEDNDDDTEYMVKTGTVGNYFVNGQQSTVVGSPTGTAISSKAAVTINGDINGKNIDKIYSITKWDLSKGRAAKVSKSDLNQITADQEFLGGDFETLKNKVIDTTSFELVGVTSLDKIAADNVVYVYWKDDNKISKVEVGTEVVTGDVTKVNSNQDKYTVNGKTYEKADNWDGKSKTPKAGDTVKFYLDHEGKVYYSDVTSGSADKYGVVVGYDKLYDKVKLYTKDDESKWFEYDDDYKSTVGAISTGGLMAYSVDSKGKVDNVETGKVYTAQNATLSATTLKVYKGTGTAALSSYRIASDATVFGLSASAIIDVNTLKSIGAGSASIEKATALGNVDTGVDLGFVTFVIDKDDIIKAIIVNNDSADKSDNDSYAVVSEINSVKNKDGDKVQQLVGFADGKALDAMTTGETTLKGFGTGPALYQIKYDASGAVNKVKNGNVGQFDTDLDAMQYIDKVADVDGNAIQASSGAVWYSAAKNAVVYRAVMKDGSIDSYKLSDIGAINKGYSVFMYDTKKEKDSAGYEVVIYVTEWK